MSDFDKILEIADDKTVQLTDEIKQLLGTELQFGMSNYVCKNGTLSEGFDKITPAQRYYQAVKECYTYSNAIQDLKAQALMEHGGYKIYTFLRKYFSWLPIVGWWIKGKAMYAERKISSILMELEDKKRIIGAFNEERLKLMPEVRSRYKCIEESEPDNWRAVLKYKMARQAIGKNEFINHVPMPSNEKAKLGIQYGSAEATLWFQVEKENELKGLTQDDLLKLASDNKIVQLKK